MYVPENQSYRGQLVVLIYNKRNTAYYNFLNPDDCFDIPSV